MVSINASWMSDTLLSNIFQITDKKEGTNQAMMCFVVLFCFAVACFVHGTVGEEVGYPTVAQAGFHHNALLYIDREYSPEQLVVWLTGEFESSGSRRLIFDAITILVQRTPFGASTAYSTNKQDWAWFIETKLVGQHSILANLTRALARLDMPIEKLQVMIMIPYVDVRGQKNFSAEWNLTIQSHRQQAIEWYVDSVKRQFEQYPNLHLWGIYLMREDIIVGIDEQVTLETSQIVHARQLRLLWIPYASASNWKNWAKLGIDIAILQPGYAFSAPLLQGTFNAGRLRATAKLAQQYGLGVEIETNQGATTEYETTLLQEYLAQGAIDAYQHAPTAYFLSNYDTIARSTKACSLIRNYTAGIRIEPTFISNVFWTWTRNDSPLTLQATTDILASSDTIPRGIRVEWSSSNSNWHGRVIVEASVNANFDDSYHWTLLSSVEIGEKNWRDEDWTSTLLPFSLAPAQIIYLLRVSFIGSSIPPKITDDNIIIERTPNGIAPQMSTGAPYRILPGMYFSTAKYGDSTNQTLSNFGRGLLTDGQWSTGEWQPTMSIAWLDNAYHHRSIHIALDFSRVTQIDQILIRTHGDTYAGINWPDAARVLVSSDCVPFSPHSSSDCNIVSYPCTARVITDGTDTNQGGFLSFNFSTSFRWVTFELLSNAWLMIDEVQAFSNGQDVSNTFSYRLLTPPASASTTATISYPDDGIRLTDGVVAGILGPITGWQKSEPHTIIVDFLVTRMIRQASVWALIKSDLAVCPPALVKVSTSLDGKIWSWLGEQGKMQMGEQMLDVQRLFVISSTACRARFVKFEFPVDQLLPGWWTMVSEVEATD